MNKPAIGDFEAFARQFAQAAAAAGKKEFLVPYFIAGHPGSDLRAMIELALYLKRHGLKPDKVQDFIPGPMDIATCMYYTGQDPFSGEPVYVPRGDRERRLQRRCCNISNRRTMATCARPSNRPIGSTWWATSRHA